MKHGVPMKSLLLLSALLLAGCSHSTSNTLHFPNKAYQYGIYDSVNVSYDIDNTGHVANVVVGGKSSDVFRRQIESDMKSWEFPAGHPQSGVTLEVSYRRG